MPLSVHVLLEQQSLVLAPPSPCTTLYTTRIVMVQRLSTLTFTHSHLESSSDDTVSRCVQRVNARALLAERCPALHLHQLGRQRATFIACQLLPMGHHGRGGHWHCFAPLSHWHGCFPPAALAAGAEAGSMSSSSGGSMSATARSRMSVWAAETLVAQPS